MTTVAGFNETAEAIAATAAKIDTRTAAAYAIKAALDDRLTGGGLFAQMGAQVFASWVYLQVQAMVQAEEAR